MKAKKVLILLLFFILPVRWLYAQTLPNEFHFLDDNERFVRIPFKFINNLIIIPISINKSDTLHFILDSGVRRPIITELGLKESLVLNYSRKSKIYGLGIDEPIEVLQSYGNDIRIGDYIASFQSVYVLLQNDFNLSTSMGTSVHGLIGYDVYKNSIVEINYDTKYITFHNPKYYKLRGFKRRYDIIPLKIHRYKPYFNVQIAINDSVRYPALMLLDTGASDAVWLFDTEKNAILKPDVVIPSFLGKGLNGDIFGSIGRLNSVYLGKYRLKDPIVALPDSASISGRLFFDDRNGSIGGEILRHFRLVVDYPNERIILYPSRKYHASFNYNMAGVEVVTPIPGFPYYEISKIYPDSPGFDAGLKVGDRILSINYKIDKDWKLDAIHELFRSKSGRKIKMKIMRNGEKHTFKFTLKGKI